MEERKERMGSVAATVRPGAAVVVAMAATATRAAASLVGLGLRCVDARRIYLRR